MLLYKYNVNYLYMSEKFCQSYERQENNTLAWKYKLNKEGAIRELNQDVEISDEENKKIEEKLQLVPKMKEALEKKLREINLSETLIQDIIERKYFILGRTPEGKIWTGTWESFQIDKQHIVVSAGHVVWLSPYATWTFEWEILWVYDLNGGKKTIREFYNNRRSDIGFISIEEANTSFYDLDKKFTSWDSSIDTGLYSSIEGDITKEDIEYSGMFYNAIINETITPERVTIVNNLIQSWDSGSVIIDEQWNPHCIVQSQVPNFWITHWAICEKIDGVKDAFRDYQLLKLQEQCDKID